MVFSPFSFNTTIAMNKINIKNIFLFSSAMLITKFCLQQHLSLTCKNIENIDFYGFILIVKIHYKEIN